MKCKKITAANKGCNQFGLNGLRKRVGTQGNFLTWDKSQPRSPKLVTPPAVVAHYEDDTRWSANNRNKSYDFIVNNSDLTNFVLS